MASDGRLRLARRRWEGTRHTRSRGSDLIAIRIGLAVRVVLTARKSCEPANALVAAPRLRHWRVQSPVASASRQVGRSFTFSRPGDRPRG